jgi:hypothetical protein
MLNSKYRVTKKSVNLKYSHLIREMFRFKPVSQFVEQHHSAVSSALNIKNLIYNNFYKLNK